MFRVERDTDRGADLYRFRLKINRLGEAKWLYLALAWLFENRDSVSDPLVQVEMIYADFDYPPEITSLVYYMPCDEPDLGSRELNEARIYANWENYLQAEAKRFSPQPT